MDLFGGSYENCKPFERCKQLARAGIPTPLNVGAIVETRLSFPKQIISNVVFLHIQSWRILSHGPDGPVFDAVGLLGPVRQLAE